MTTNWTYHQPEIILFLYQSQEWLERTDRGWNSELLYQIFLQTTICNLHQNTQFMSNNRCRQGEFKVNSRWIQGEFKVNSNFFKFLLPRSKLIVDKIQCLCFSIRGVFNLRFMNIFNIYPSQNQIRR